MHVDDEEVRGESEYGDDIRAETAGIAEAGHYRGPLIMMDMMDADTEVFNEW